VGWLQGGLYTALCDEAMAFFLFTALEDGDVLSRTHASFAIMPKKM
jgi:acyl-coenzyme A thioesterase PaaI-like protein